MWHMCSVIPCPSAFDLKYNDLSTPRNRFLVLANHSQIRVIMIVLRFYCFIYRVHFFSQSFSCSQRALIRLQGPIKWLDGIQVFDLVKIETYFKIKIWIYLNYSSDFNKNQEKIVDYNSSRSQSRQIIYCFGFIALHFEFTSPPRGFFTFIGL